MCCMSIYSWRMKSNKPQNFSRRTKGKVEEGVGGCGRQGKIDRARKKVRIGKLKQ